MPRKINRLLYKLLAIWGTSFLLSWGFIFYQTIGAGFVSDVYAFFETISVPDVLFFLRGGESSDPSNFVNNILKLWLI